MKPIQNLIDLNQKQKCFTANALLESKNPKTINNRIDFLFVALGNKFFEKFTGRFPTSESLRTAKILWEKDLADLTDEQLRYGLDACKDWRSDFAPNLSDFRKICLSRPNYNFYQSLPKPQLTEQQLQQGKYHLDKMRKLIKRRRIGE